MEQFSAMFLEFIAAWGYLAVAVLMAAENACIPVPSELILGFAGYLIFSGQMSFAGALTAGMIGGMAGSVFAYLVGHYGGRTFVDRYGHYFLVKKKHVDVAQRWFDQYGLKAVFFSRMLPVVRTFISLPAGFAHVDMKRFLALTFAGALPWTALILYAGMMLGESWKILTHIGHEASLVFIGVMAAVVVFFYLRHRRKRKQTENVDWE
ncbi:DedA family protein [Selenomonas sp. WCA-380-WT-3B 3/]|uniref:DedA family protein n=1 Tax=Selenomonas montiformis TaxID=2652285 RepID=A0A6I2V2N4_9FIRM|nr:DedA family protein [Selenomonas montiformis]MSV25732.1 DedA family protein [Selenomonas montiformis]